MNIAFMKADGLAAGGSETWLQLLARSLAEAGHSVAFFVGHGEDRRAETVGRRQELETAGVRVIDFSFRHSSPGSAWADTDLWELFDASAFDLVQTAKAGPPEYPYDAMRIPVVECVCLLAGVDRSPTIAWSVHTSEWQRARWVQAGGSAERSSVIPVPIDDRQIVAPFDLRARLGLQADALVAGFHQRDDDRIYSPIPLAAFSAIDAPNAAFVILGGGAGYREQAARLGDPRVHLLDHTADKAEVGGFVRSLDVYAHGRGDGETFGGAIAEAMAAGLPVLAHESVRGANAHRDTIASSGLWARDEREYENHLRRLIREPALRTELGGRAASHTGRYFGLELATANLEAVYARVIGGERRRMLSYGRTRWGYLQAGDTADPAELAFQIPTQGAPELHDVRRMLSLTRGGDLVIDVGANAGLYCSVAVNAGRRAIAFEPDPRYADQLRSTAELNDWDGKLDVRECALGASAGAMDLHPAGTGSTLVPAFSSGDITGPPQRIRVSTLDAELAGEAAPVRLIKIDVEGFELDVLRGGRRIISRDRPVLLIEIAARRATTGFVSATAAETFDLLREHGYCVFEAERGIAARPLASLPDLDGARNYLAIHERVSNARLSAVRGGVAAQAADAAYRGGRLRRRIDPYDQLRRNPGAYARGVAEVLRRTAMRWSP